jgi:hypothetical protein
MIQIPVLSIVETNGVFTFEGPNGMGQVMGETDIESEAMETMANYELAFKLARCHWWMSRKNAADKAAHDAAHCRMIAWNPAEEIAVAYD